MIEVLTAVAGFSLLAALAGKTGLGIYRTVASSVQGHSTNQDVEADLAVLDRISALTDLMILAIIADGEVYNSELEKMDKALRGHESELNHKEVL